ncbi:hypothetical protein [Pseudoalteromonas sp. M8]|uniref:hypothetical protein n=1 Tax=Pseudoalteromonas sp. M8 TaxID=2692624 RepID=UPI001BA482BF|nr:hypothetical protein [Pseudoalteromonas sp. M8]QUI71241.1 hypothetical protein GSF13_16450 [Pseudoalteromonas sp. M8]
MKLNEQLTIGGVPVTTIEKKLVQLDIGSTGRASFQVVCDFEPAGLVELHIGYELEALEPYFLGVIESKLYSNGLWHLTCRELIGALSFKIPMAIRHATIEKVLAELSQGQLEFVIPNVQYSKAVVPAFHHAGTGIEALRQIGAVWQIPHYIVQQRPDGKIYVGSWEHSKWATSEVSEFPEHAIKTINSLSGEVLAIPKLRPGIKINGRYITEMTLKDDRMQLRWSNKLLNGSY